jgi:hypothetical protein
VKEEEGGIDSGKFAGKVKIIAKLLSSQKTLSFF